MKIVEDRSGCYGCGACAQSCPTHAITMKEDEEGFLYPSINEELCVKCGKCIEKCQSHFQNHYIDQSETVALAVKNKDNVIRMQSSSGGVFYALAKWTVNSDGVVFGAAFDTNFDVIHRSVKEEQDIALLMGSKYAQSDIGNTYAEALEYLLDGRWVLFTGTPCQIRGLKRYLEGECDTTRLICVSVICHGVCSPMVWRKYLRLKMGQYSKEKIKRISFRDKKQGWKQFGLHIVFDTVEYEQTHSGDLYMKGFLQDLYLRPSCYACEAKKYMKDSDIILGDFWGIEKVVPQFDDNCGVSCVLLNSAKGRMIWDEIEGAFAIAEVSVEQVKKGNSALESSASQNSRRAVFFEELKETELIEESIKDNLKSNVISETERKIVQYPIIYKYLNNVIKGIKVNTFFADLGWKHIALYAYTDLMQVAFEDIIRMDDITITCIGDKGYMNYPKLYKNVRIEGVDYVANSVARGETDGIVVCNPLRENAIVNELLLKGVPAEKIVSVTGVIFN